MGIGEIQRGRGHVPPADVVLSARLLADEATRQGATVQWIHRACFVANVEGRPIGFRCARTDLVSSVAEHLTTRKDLTNEILHRAGLPAVPTRSYHASHLDEARVALVPGREYTVKPSQGRSGRGVTVGVRTADELEAAWATAAEIDPSWVLVQPTVSGREVRLLVVQGEVIAMCEKRPASIVGDGSQSIEELIDAQNLERCGNPHLSQYPLSLNDESRVRLRHSGRGKGSVLGNGQTLVLSRKASLSDGGTSHDLTGQVDPALERLAVAAVNCFPGLGVAGVDLIVTDPSTAHGATVLEINSMPGLGMHHFPMTGEPRSVAVRIVEATLAAASRPNER